jgi:hypothetical protein
MMASFASHETSARGCRMFSVEDFKVESPKDLLQFLPIVIFMGLCAPYIIGAYTLGFVMNIFGLLD